MSHIRYALLTRTSSILSTNRVVFLTCELQQVDISRGADSHTRFQSLSIVVHTEDALRQSNQLCGRLITQHATQTNPVIILSVFISSPVEVRSIAISVSVCLSVCSHFSKTRCSNFIKLSVHVYVTCGRGMVVL